MSKASGQAFSVGQTIQLFIDRLSYHGGRGVGRLNDFVFFVPKSAPEEWVEAEVVEIKKSFGVARLLRIIEPSRFRREPPCPVVNRCGGCPWQHIVYEEQVRQKTGLLLNALKPIPKAPNFIFEGLVAAPDEFGYRNRIQVHRLGHRVGFLQSGSRTLVETDQCLIAEANVSSEIQRLQAGFSNALERFEIARPLKGTVQAYPARHSPSSALFSQVNARQNDFLIARVLSWCQEANPKVIFDLYCGSGNFTLPVRAAFPESQIVGVELSRAAIDLAHQRELELFGSKKIHWLAAPSNKMRQSRLATQGSAIILDPPRPGCDRKTLEALVTSRASRIIYVSCNPATFARDAAALTKSGSYTLDRVCGIDMFPQTEHIELVALFCFAANGPRP